MRMKPGRQTVIIEIISEKNIETQQQLIEELAARGIRSTQATLSRDIRDLKLIKEPSADGRSRYVRKEEPEEEKKAEDIMKAILRPSVKSYEAAQNIVVIKTFPGLASAACAAIDSMQLSGLVGTIAGEDTIFIAMKTSQLAEELVEKMHEIL